MKSRSCVEYCTVCPGFKSPLLERFSFERRRTKNKFYLGQARIHTGFHRFTEIGQNFHNKKKKKIDMYLTFIFCLFFFANYRK